jgi:GNAT superfamily N-acetyltransferase
MVDVRIRQSFAEDAGQLAAVQLASALAGYAHIFPETIPKPTQETLAAGWADLIASEDVIVVAAEAQGRIVGCIAYTGSRARDARSGRLMRLYVLPDFEGEGIGGSLHDVAVAEMRTVGFEQARLWVLEKNSRARAMYERRGWIPTGDRKSDWPGTGIYEVGYKLAL